MTAPATPWIWERLGRRAPTLRTVVALLQARPSLQILELGTTRSFRQGVIETRHFDPDPASWDWGAGCFTYACLSLLPEARVTSVDISREALGVATTLCADFKDRLEAVLSDSTSFLSQTEQRFDLIYMDHAEAGQTDQAASLHLQDAKAIVSRSLLKPQGLILIDDVEVPPGQFSKGLYSIPFLQALGFEPLASGCYQALLRQGC